MMILEYFPQISVIQGFTMSSEVEIILKVSMVILQMIQFTSGLLSVLIIGPVVGLVLFDLLRYVYRLLSSSSTTKQVVGKRKMD